MVQNDSKITFLDRLMKALTPHLGGDTRSPTKVGRFLGMNKQTVARWFDNGIPAPDTLFLIADKTGVDARWLAIGDCDMTPAPKLSTGELDAIEHIYRPLARNKKALEKWLRDGRELVEFITEKQT